VINTASLTRWTLASVLALALVSPLLASAQASFKRIVVFGTSLSDPGNAFALAGGTNTPPDYDNDPFLVPNTPYARGGHHFSNGATWIEQFARPIGLAGNVGPAFRGSGGATNYAVGGARAREFGESPTLSLQVGAFLQQFGGAAPSNALYVIEMGGNDLRDALGALLLLDPTGATSFAIIDAALTAIEGNIRILYAAGARKFLVWNAPNIGLTPAIAPLGPVVAGFADGFAQTFNGRLESEFLARVRSELDGIQIVTLNIYDKVNGVVLSPNPAEFGFTNVNTACINPATAPFACQNADEYFFWDGIHPTKAAHAIIAQTVASVLVP
jgi:phospholipase/lecithinase/hemolysin